jgi:hypothetical protein
VASQDSRHIFSCQGAIKWTIFIFICVKWPSCISPADVSIYLYAPVFVLFSPFDFFFGRYAECFFLFSNFCLFAGCRYLQLLHPGVAYYQLLYSQKKNPPKNLGSENCNWVLVRLREKFIPRRNSLLQEMFKTLQEYRVLRRVWRIKLRSPSRMSRTWRRIFYWIQINRSVHDDKSAECHY